MTREDWLKRYRQRFIVRIDPKGLQELMNRLKGDKPGLIERIADDCVGAVTFEEASDGYEDDPEGAADGEMSYWTD
jgi:hypothetical protein